MSSVPFLYRVAIRAARRSAPLLAVGDSKLARGIRGRRAAVETLTAWGVRERDPDRPTVWFHAPSVGEGLQAGAVMATLAERRPGLQVAFTHFSPSAEGLGEKLGADVSAYLPWDVEGPAGEALDALEPRLLVFTKTEVWPVLVEQATRRGIPVAVVGATVREGSGRMRWLARSALRTTWRRLVLACANTREDGERLVELGVKPAAVHVTGDPAIDSAAVRAADADPGAPYLAPFASAGRPVLIAGSTWRPDEDVLLPAWEGIRRAVPEALLVVVPHEPTPQRVRSLLARLRAMGLVTVTLGALERKRSAEGVDVVIVDRVGVLAKLYRVASVAFVGGGFGRDGLHSVLEPAAAGAPTLFGPRHQNARAAAELLESGAARSVIDRTTLEKSVLAWLEDPTEKSRATRKALDYIGAHRGAAVRTAELLEPLIEQREQQ
ncbi:MAG: glycosyltransferase N-terminal domain-containing protein [Gemmatimonadota bacterium]